MLSACPNARLLELISGVRQAYHRYESLLVADEAMITRTAAEHADIAHQLTRGDVAGAVAALKRNWTNGAHRILESADTPYMTA
jgi:DNA-binding GntR family transcriptional regulator